MIELNLLLPLPSRVQLIWKTSLITRKKLATMFSIALRLESKMKVLQDCTLNSIKKRGKSSSKSYGVEFCLLDLLLCFASTITTQITMISFSPPIIIHRIDIRQFLFPICLLPLRSMPKTLKIDLSNPIPWLQIRPFLCHSFLTCFCGFKSCAFSWSFSLMGPLLPFPIIIE